MIRAFPWIALLALASSTGAIAAQAEPSADAHAASLRGRCIAAGSSTPLAGARVKLSGTVHRESFAVHWPCEWRDPEPVLSDATGRFEVRFTPPRTHEFNLLVERDGCSPRTGRYFQVEAGQVIDVGDVTMTSGFEVHGKVLDSTGRPVAKAGVALADLPLALDPRSAPNTSAYAWTNEHGEYVLDSLVPAGTWPLFVGAEGCKRTGPLSVTVREKGGTEPVITVLDRVKFTITGTVVDEQDHPVPRARLIGTDRQSWPASSTHSRDDGTFVLYAVDDAPRPVWIEVLDAGAYDAWRSPGNFLWGAGGVRIVLQRALALELTVVERGSGTPVERFAVRCHAADDSSIDPTTFRFTDPHPGGRLVVDGIRRGETELQVVALDPALERSAAIRFRADDRGVPPMRIELARKTPLSLRIQQRGGSAVPGSVVELCALGARQTTPEVGEHVPDAHDAERWEGGKYDGPRRLDHARSDARGHARLHTSVDTKDLVVRALGPGHVPAARRLVDLPREGDVSVLVVDAGVSIRGTSRPSSVLVWPTIVELMPAAPRDSSSLRPRRATPGQDGRFEFPDVAPGKWTVRWIATLHASLHETHKPRSEGRSYSVALTEVALAIAADRHEPVELNLDADHWVPARLELKITLDDKPPGVAHLRLLGSRDSQSWECGWYPLTAEGTFVASTLPPGKYRIWLVRGPMLAGAAGALEAAERIELASGATVSRTVRFRSR